MRNATEAALILSTLRGTFAPHTTSQLVCSRLYPSAGEVAAVAADVLTWSGDGKRAVALLGLVLRNEVRL